MRVSLGLVGEVCVCTCVCIRVCVCVCVHARASENRDGGKVQENMKLRNRLCPDRVGKFCHLEVYDDPKWSAKCVCINSVMSLGKVQRTNRHLDK